jgi:AraC-like DNA-binding protein
MAYERRQLVAEVDTQLTRTPRKTLREICEELGVERHTIERSMRELIGKSFREVEREKTLQRFLQLLKERATFSEKQIAAELGYLSLEAFSRFIKAMTGRSPKDIRRNSRIQQLLRKRIDRQ